MFQQESWQLGLLTSLLLHIRIANLFVIAEINTSPCLQEVIEQAKHEVEEAVTFSLQGSEFPHKNVQSHFCGTWESASVRV